MTKRKRTKRKTRIYKKKNYTEN